MLNWATRRDLDGKNNLRKLNPEISYHDFAAFKKLDNQYSLKKIFIIWALSAMPMGDLAYIITPRVVAVTNWHPMIIYWIAVMFGLLWQFILALVILKRDGHQLSWRTVIKRMKYHRPKHPTTGKSSYWLLLLTIPFILLSALLQSGLISLPKIDSWMTLLIQFLPKYDLSSMATAEYKVLGGFLYYFY